MTHFRLIVEKKPDFQIHKQRIQSEIQNVLQLPVELQHYLLIYDVFHCSKEAYQQLKETILLDAVTDIEVESIEFKGKNYFAIELLPGQFDQTADAALQCLQLIAPNETNCVIKTTTAYVFHEDANPHHITEIQHYFLNPVESRLVDLSTEPTLATVQPPINIELIDGFMSATINELTRLKAERGLAMSVDDLVFIQRYFRDEEHRDPTETELMVLDTYWSDHCRHTTFLTEITSVAFEEGAVCKEIENTWQQYLATRATVYGERLTEKPVCLMDLATLAAKDLKQRGILTSVEESDEINACSVYTKVKTDRGEEDWLLMFKNETHNHPTEIEPFGGASTCLGGCIRDPLSGRAYVYQAMRVSGAANVLEPIQNTLPGKLPQQKITTEAAHGFSSYGNQIGLATTQVSEVYHEGYKAKRMEVGAVVAAAPAKWVKREQPVTGDVILLLGGKTGRDGVGGATGSSKEHTEESIETASAEVQKGNPPEERKIQRFFRNGTVTKLIKKCNDFGAGGVSVAIGELADSLMINLDVIPTKYAGLNGTELALSESQERMAVVLDPANVEQFIKLAEIENLEVTPVAKVTDDNRLTMFWKNEKIVDLSRTFLDTNGVRQSTTAKVIEPDEHQPFQQQYETLTDCLGSLQIASQQGLAEQFDSTIGSSTVQMPFGGSYQLTPAEGSIQKFPLLHGETTTSSAMTWGFDPDISSWSPYHGGAYAVIHSLAKLVTLGANPKDAYFTFQEYFRKLGADPKNWGLPFSALLGAFKAQEAFECAAIGGKDSMSGTFLDIHVPPTLISFAVASLDAEITLSNELKETGSTLYLLQHTMLENGLPNYPELNRLFTQLHQWTLEGKILSAGTLQKGGLAASLAKASFGNKIGVTIETDCKLYDLSYGSIYIESKEELAAPFCKKVGFTTDRLEIDFNGEITTIDDAITAWQKPLEPIFPTRTQHENELEWKPFHQHVPKAQSAFKGKPRVFIPAFPGTNCEYDSQRAFDKAGANTTISVFRNLTPEWIDESIEEYVKQINRSQILMLSGGFSASDEPDGSGKFITAVLQNEKIYEAIQQLLARDGLVLGICNGFQALIKSGLLPFGEIQTKQSDFPTLSTNAIGRHISQIIRTKVVSTKSPWLSSYNVGDEHQIAISHGEGRFYVTDELATELFKNGQIATQYVDNNGNPTMKRPHNPNGSTFAIEGVSSACGKIFGKMGHSERKGTFLYQNIPGEVGQDLFKNGVRYFE